MSLYSSVLRRMSRRRWFAAAASRLAPALDRLAFRVSGRRWLATPRSLPTLMLTARGRRSGAMRTVPLVYLEDGDDFVVVGTNWGHATTPEWTLNLAANPRCCVEVLGGPTADVTAARIPGSEQGPLWERFEELWPAYAVYRERAGSRQIMMFRLAPDRPQ